MLRAVRTRATCTNCNDDDRGRYLQYCQLTGADPEEGLDREEFISLYVPPMMRRDRLCACVRACVRVCACVCVCVRQLHGVVSVSSATQAGTVYYYVLATVAR